MATSPRPPGRNVAAEWVEQELPFLDLARRTLTGTRQRRDGDLDQDHAESISTTTAERRLAIRGYTVEHGDEDADRYLLALQHVLGHARVRLLNEAQHAKGPAA